MSEVWYRYVDSDQEWSRDPYEMTFNVLRYTPKCVVLDMRWGFVRFEQQVKYVLLNARRRFAYPTRELAMESYIARKQREISLTAAQHDRAVEYLAAAKEMRDRGYKRERTEVPAPWFEQHPSASLACPSQVSS